MDTIKKLGYLKNNRYEMYKKLNLENIKVNVLNLFIYYVNFYFYFVFSEI